MKSIIGHVTSFRKHRNNINQSHSLKNGPRLITSYGALLFKTTGSRGSPKRAWNRQSLMRPCSRLSSNWTRENEQCITSRLIGILQPIVKWHDYVFSKKFHWLAVTVTRTRSRVSLSTFFF